MVTASDIWEIASRGASLEDQRSLLEKGLLERGVPTELVTAAMSEARDGFLLYETSEKTRSRAGGAGSVCLPTGETWPLNYGDPLAFLFEICLDDLVGPTQAGVPSSGALLLFHDEEPGLEGSYLAATRVLYRPPNDPGVETTEGAGYDWQPSGEIALKGLAFPTLAIGVELEAVFESVLADEARAMQAATDFADSVGELVPRRSPVHRLFTAPPHATGTPGHDHLALVREPRCRKRL